MQHSDILIVGGGPAGATLAWALKDSGLSVRILDKQSFPRDKTCAGWVTPAVFESLDMEPGDYAIDHVLQPITGFRISMMNQPVVENLYGAEEEPVSYGIRRCEFDNYLLRRSKAQLVTGVGIQDIKRQQGQWIVNDVYSADLLVGAGGHFCPVARLLGARLGQAEKIVAAKEIEFQMTPAQLQECRVSGEIPELYFCEDLKGYGWAFRKGAYLNIGLGREDNQHLSDHLDEFVENLQATGRIPMDIPTRFKGHAYILYDHGMREVTGNHVLLIGDALGLAYTQSGEGIRPAVESALLAAQVICRLQGDYSSRSLEEYGSLIQERFGVREKDRLLSVPLPAVFKKNMAKTLMRSSWFTRYVLTDRWFLHRHKAPLTGLPA